MMATYEWAKRSAEADAWLLDQMKGDQAKFDRAIHLMGQYHQKGGRQTVANYGFTLLRYTRGEAREKKRLQRERRKAGQLSTAERLDRLENPYREI